MDDAAGLPLKYSAKLAASASCSANVASVYAIVSGHHDIFRRDETHICDPISCFSKHSLA